MSDLLENTIWKIYKQFKLSKSLLTCEYRIDNDLVVASKQSEGEIEQIVRRHIADGLADRILSDQPSIIKRLPVEDGDKTLKFGATVMVLDIDDFKTIVEVAIQMLPEEHIIKIRNGEI